MSQARHKRKIKVELQNGEEKLLFFNGNALAELEKLLGRKVLALLHSIGTKTEAEILETIGYGEVRAFLYAGMLGAGARNMTLERVGDLMHTDGPHLRGYLEAVMSAIGVAATGDMPQQQDTEEAPEDEDPTT